MALGALEQPGPVLVTALAYCRLHWPGLFALREVTGAPPRLAVMFREMEMEVRARCWRCRRASDLFECIAAEACSHLQTCR